MLNLHELSVCMQMFEAHSRGDQEVEYFECPLTHAHTHTNLHHHSPVIVIHCCMETFLLYIRI